MARTGVIGLIAVTGVEKFKGGVRLTFVCGGRALRSLRQLRDAVAGSVRVLSVLPQELPAAVEKLQAEGKGLRKTIAGLQAALAVHEADRLLAAVARRRRLDAGVIAEVYEGWDANGLKTIASSLIARDPVAVALVASGPQPLVVVACAPSLGLDASAVLRRLTERFGGRGGGRPDLAQAGGLTGQRRRDRGVAARARRADRAMPRAMTIARHAVRSRPRRRRGHRGHLPAGRRDHVDLVRDRGARRRRDAPAARRHAAAYPWLVCEIDGDVAGYAYATTHRVRAAYRWSVDTSVYVDAAPAAAGVGRGLYRSLFAILAAQGFVNAFAGIALPNPGSVALHEAVGFEPLGVYRRVGFKFGDWHDVGWWQLALTAHEASPDAPLRSAACAGARLGRPARARRGVDSRHGRVSAPDDVRGGPRRRRPRIGLRAATTLNMLSMIGAGPFLTIPLIIQAMHGPQSLVAWIVGAVVALADGLVWAELGAALPRSGGGYQYLLEAYGPQRLGRLMSFLFLWQTMIAFPLTMASGAVGFAFYASYLVPSLGPWQRKAARRARLPARGRARVPAHRPRRTMGHGVRGGGARGRRLGDRRRRRLRAEPRGWRAGRRLHLVRRRSGPDSARRRCTRSTTISATTTSAATPAKCGARRPPSRARSCSRCCSSPASTWR